MYVSSLVDHVPPKYSKKTAKTKRTGTFILPPSSQRRQTSSLQDHVHEHTGHRRMVCAGLDVEICEGSWHAHKPFIKKTTQEYRR